MRTGLAFIFAILVAFSLFVWGNQRHAQATLATEILCLVDIVGDGQDGNTGIFPMFEEDCESGGGEVVDYCPNIPGDQGAEDLPCTVPPQCNDGLDNDNDGKIDWGVPGDQNADPGCSTPTDDSESPDPVVPAQCADGADNDSDGLVDLQDPGCSSADDNDETNVTPPAPACSNGQDDDSDGLVDMNDPGCSNAEDNDESNGGGGNGGNPQCSDGVDNDGDNLVDTADPGCTDANDNNETDEGGSGGNGGTTECSDGIDNDGDGHVDMNDQSCEDASDDNEDGEAGGSSGGGGGGSRRGSSSQGEILGAQTGECSMYLTGYIRYGAQNDASEVLKLQSFLNDFEGNSLAITGIYDAPTLAAVNAFQAKYAAEVLQPWGMRGPSGYVYYTTQKMINTIYCRGQKEFPLSEAQLNEIAGVRTVQPALRASGPTGSSQGAADQIGSTVPAVGSVVLPVTQDDENAGIIDANAATAGAANASSTQGWFSRFVNWLFGR